MNTTNRSASDSMNLLETHGWAIGAMRNFNLGMGSVAITKPGKGTIMVYGRTVAEGLSRAVDHMLASR